MTDGSDGIAFVKFNSHLEQETAQAVWGGNEFKAWTGADYYVFGDRTALYMGENGSGAGLTFSIQNISTEDYNSIVKTQNEGGAFSADQLQLLGRSMNEALIETPGFQKAKAEAAIGGTLGAGAIEACASGVLRNVFFATPKNGAVFYTGGARAARAAEDYALGSGGKTIGMTPGGKVLDALTNARIGRFSIRDTAPYLNDKLWRFGSRHFADGASGSATLFRSSGQLRPNNIFQSVEQPRLILNNTFINTRRIPFFTTR